ncbi:hypothetical protein OCU04_013102 [Sclerotinia nivalis]|uniref:Dipeptidyl peptidase III n=1 Tax=Sclerotinia nivalis TaxID=352851 RepID=A0A9X0A803_9HELO|nr:hypothetical protein OCU04_013102 [Sclerotinia nivalis]
MHGLSSLGCFYPVLGDGDRKVIPNVSHEALRKMASVSPEASAKLEEIIGPMMETQPAALGYPDEASQSSYYIGKEHIKKEDIEAITKMMEARRISPENTRLQKLTTSNRSADENSDVFEILQASAEKDAEPLFLSEITIGDGRRARVYLRRGDHCEEMSKICAELTQASKVAANDEQRTVLSQLVDSFRTGDYDAFRSAHKTWITDKAPRVEHCMGFLFGYRDPHGVRAEWQAVAGICHSGETNKMGQLVGRSTEFIRTLPWAVPNDNDGKGPFEPSELNVPDFAVIHVLASVSSTVWEATNITIDDDGKRHGVKNMVYGNRMNLNSSPGRPCYYVQPSEVETYVAYTHRVRFVATAIHELIGHGTGKLVAETVPGKFNFDHENPPISPVTGEPIQTWYKPGETWNSVFGKLAATVEECRAFLVADYLADNKDILALFGYDQDSTPTADDFIYYTYLQMGVEGLRALRSFKAKEQIWGGDHDQAQFAILKHMLQDSNGVLRIAHDPQKETLHVHIDRSKIISHGKPSIGRMLCKMHIWHSTADIDACRPLYKALSAVDGKYEMWRKIVVSNPEPRWKFVQPNTFFKEDGTVELREYEPSNMGIMQSFFERAL